MDTLIKTSLGFSTADAEIISANYEKESLIVKIKDWKENIISINFQDIIAYNVQLINESYANDTTYLVQNSSWSRKQLNILTDDDPLFDFSEYKHYKLCFNLSNTEINAICKIIAINHGQNNT